MRPHSIFEVAPAVLGLRTVMVNLFFVSSPLAAKSWVLIDAGLRGSGPRIYDLARQRFGENNPPQAVILTHGHFDHTGALPWLLSGGSRRCTHTGTNSRFSTTAHRIPHRTLPSVVD
jgi:glyoxylase-like metal-dependent hydrolase (beta-lactamase superfamily II)